MSSRLWIFAGMALALLGCKPGVGSSCDKGEARCLDKGQQLSCQDGKYIAAPCRGPKGCAITPAGITCDISKNKPDDACSTDDEGAAACTDDKTLIVCQGGKYVAAPCRGPKGCSQNAGRPTCDTSVATVDDACKEQDKPKACSTSGRQFLECEGGKMVVRLECRGPDGCKSEGGKLNCDLTLAKQGDSCPKEMDGKHACSEDRKSILVCKGATFAMDSPCEGKKSCLTEGGSIRCDTPEKDPAK